MKLKCCLFVCVIGELEFSPEAKTALEEITANTALILKVEMNRHTFSLLSVCFLYSFVSFYQAIRDSSAL